MYFLCPNFLSRFLSLAVLIHSEEDVAKGNTKPLGSIAMDKSSVRNCIEVLLRLVCCYLLFSSSFYHSFFFFFFHIFRLSHGQDLEKDFCFEIVTQSRVYKFVCGTLQEMIDWLHILTPCTLLHADNEHIKQVRDLAMVLFFSSFCILSFVSACLFLFSVS
jgi:hypothetical protein